VTVPHRPGADPSTTTTPAGVLFDMDGLLVATESTWFEVETEIMAGLGAPWGREHQAALVGGPLRHSAEYMLRIAARPDLAVEDIESAMLAGMVTHLRRGPVDWMPGARELLAQVAVAGIPAALVSSSSRSIVDAVLDAVGRQHFAATVSSDDVERTKPHPHPYLTAARALGVDAALCVALEDSAPGAASARAAGCVVVAVPSVGPVDPADVDAVVDSLTEVDVPWLGALLARVRWRGPGPGASDPPLGATG
jgi:HAD superfamily hydrolase (TIGR01509 family)